MTGLNLRYTVRIIYLLNVCSLISSQVRILPSHSKASLIKAPDLLRNSDLSKDLGMRLENIVTKTFDKLELMEKKLDALITKTDNLEGIMDKHPTWKSPDKAKDCSRVENDINQGKDSSIGVPSPPLKYDCGKQGDIDVNPISTVFARKRRNAKGGFYHRVVVGGKKSKDTHGLGCDEFYLRLREYDYKEDFDGSFPEDIAVEDFILHPKYDWITGYDDLAIVKMANDVMITDSAKPVCLPWNENFTKNLVNKVAIVTGWGETQYGGSASSVLQEVEVTVFNSSNCEQLYSKVQDFRESYPKGLTVDNIICAGDSEGRKDACRGDSGAPLVFYQSSVDRYQLAGIVAGGYGCGKKGYPGLYTSVWNEFNLQWIKDVAFIMDKIL